MINAYSTSPWPSASLNSVGRRPARSLNSRIHSPLPFRFGVLVALRRYDPLEARSFHFGPMLGGEAGHSSPIDHWSSLVVLEGRLDGAATECPLNFPLTVSGAVDRGTLHSRLIARDTNGPRPS